MKSFKRATYKISNYDKQAEEQQISCNGALNTSGQIGIYEVEINLGTDTGDVIIDYESYSIPDRFEVIKDDGTVLADSKFVGDSLDSYNDQLIGSHTLSVFTYNDGSFIDSGETETITIDTSDIADGSVTEPKSGKGSLKFNKPENKNWVVKLRVTGAISSTAWNIAATCPQEPNTDSGGDSTDSPSTSIYTYRVPYQSFVKNLDCDSFSTDFYMTVYTKEPWKVGIKVFSDKQLFNVAPSGYYLHGTAIYQVDGGKISTEYPCYTLQHSII